MRLKPYEKCNRKLPFGWCYCYHLSPPEIRLCLVGCRRFAISYAMHTHISYVGCVAINSNDSLIQHICTLYTTEPSRSMRPKTEVLEVRGNFLGFFYDNRCAQIPGIVSDAPYLARTFCANRASSHNHTIFVSDSGVILRLFSSRWFSE